MVLNRGASDHSTLSRRPNTIEVDLVHCVESTRNEKMIRSIVASTLLSGNVSLLLYYKEDGKDGKDGKDGDTNIVMIMMGVVCRLARKSMED
jgi:hypothetical protein